MMTMLPPLSTTLPLWGVVMTSASAAGAFSAVAGLTCSSGNWVTGLTSTWVLTLEMGVYWSLALTVTLAGAAVP